MASSVFLEVHFKGKVINKIFFFFRSVTLKWIEALKHFFFHFFLFAFFPSRTDCSKLPGCELILSGPVLARKETTSFSSNNFGVIAVAGRTSKKLESCVHE